MLFLLKPAMLKSIEDHVYKAKQGGHILDVYRWPRTSASNISATMLPAKTSSKN